MKLIQSRQTPMALAVLIAAGGITAPQIAWTQESMALEEVVVTARRREENSNDGFRGSLHTSSV